MNFINTVRGCIDRRNHLIRDVIKTLIHFLELSKVIGIPHEGIGIGIGIGVGIDVGIGVGIII